MLQTSPTSWKTDLYNDKHSFVYQYGENLLELLAPKPGERILDLGCGSGQLAAKIKELGAEVIGIDNSAEMVADARQKFPDIDFVQMDATDFDFAEPFDAIFSNAVLHWVVNKEPAIASMYRNLKPGGRIAAEFGGKGNVETIVNQLRSTLTAYGFSENARRTIFYFPSIGEYSTLLEKQGFRVTLARHYDRPTELIDREHGIQDWLEMFGNGFLKGVPDTEKQQIKKEVQEKVKAILYMDGKWYADYKRLRIMAIKE